MLVHNNGWRIVRDRAEYKMISPTGEVFAMQKKNPILARLTAPIREHPIRAMT